MIKRLFLEKVFIRNIEYWSLLELFLVSAVSTVIIVRFFLEVTGYPRIGGANFHIAHMLWGGLLMCSSFIASVSFFSKRVDYLASLLAGIGFGLFIDELGKFITADNNYLYQPTLALIYVIFILLFLLIRRIGSGSFTQEEYLINSIEIIKEGVIGELTKEEKETALRYLSYIKNEDRTVHLLQTAYKEVSIAPPSRIDIIGEYIHRARTRYKQIAEKKWFTTGVILFFVIGAVGTVFGAVAIGLYYLLRSSLNLHMSLDFSYSTVIQFISSMIGAVFVLVGITKLRYSHIEAFNLFKRYVLIDILISTVFEFYTNQLWAVTGLLFNLILLTSLNFMIESEKEVRAAKIVKK